MSIRTSGKRRNARLLFSARFIIRVDVIRGVLHHTPQRQALGTLQLLWIPSLCCGREGMCRVRVPTYRANRRHHVWCPTEMDDVVKHNDVVPRKNGIRRREDVLRCTSSGAAVRTDNFPLTYPEWAGSTAAVK